MAVGVTSAASAHPTAMTENAMDRITAAGLAEDLHALNLPDSLISRIQSALTLGNGATLTLSGDDVAAFDSAHSAGGATTIFQSNTNINDNGRTTSRTISIVNGRLVTDRTVSR